MLDPRSITRRSTLPRSASFAIGSSLLVATAVACSSPKSEAPASRTSATAGIAVPVRDTTVVASFEAAGTAAPVRQATLSTRLMGTVLAVSAQAGDAVARGEPLVRIDARDLAARQVQVEASVAGAEAAQREAQTQATRMRALFVDSAATQAQLDAAESGLAQANAALRAAHAGTAELGATQAYAVVRAPFNGIVTARLVDPGAFAAPGTPLMTVQDPSQLRISANVTPDIARGVRRGQHLDATVEGRQVDAVVEGVIPAASGNLTTINALIANPARSILAGSAATLLVPGGTHTTPVVPAAAVFHQGDLTGVTVRTARGDETRWIRPGRQIGDLIEVNAGVRAGDQVVVPNGTGAGTPEGR